MSLSVQCRIGCTRRCAPGGGEALKWFQNSGGWSRTSHKPSAPRGENTRSLARVASSSRRMPAIKPSKPCLASASLSPSVLRAAERAAGGNVGSMASIGGQARSKRSSCHSFAVAFAERVHLGKFLAGIDVHDREGHAAEEGLAREPDHHVGVFSERPQQRDVLQPRECLAQNVDALRFELVETVHDLFRSCRVSAKGSDCGDVSRP